MKKTVKLGVVENIAAVKIANVIINQKVDISKISSQEIISQIIEQTSGVISDEAELEKYAKSAIEDNPQIVEAFKKGKTTVIMALVGIVMRKSSGKADATKVKEILENLITQKLD